MDILVPKENEQYQQYIDRILTSRENIKDLDNYQELHHIVPRCMNGSNNSDNLVYLYPQEHYYAHYLLFLENRENPRICHAWIMMAFQPKHNGIERNYQISADEYALAKEINAQETSKRFKGKKQDPESVKKRTQKTSGKGNGMYGKKGVLSPSYGKQRFGSDNPFYGCLHTKETKSKISQKNKGKLFGNKNPSARAVVCINTGEVFLTIQEAAIFSGTNHSGSNIVRCCKRKLQTCGKHPKTVERLKWRYATEDEKEKKINSLINP